MITLAELFRELDTRQDRIELDFLEEKLKQLDIKPGELDAYIKFGEETYRRNLLHTGPNYHALILCWKPGQRSPIHDHRGSSCGVRVLRGKCTETIFDRTPAGHIYPTHTHHLPTGFCCGSQDTDIHQISNIDPAGEDLVTLHVYSPPLLVMGTYTLHDKERGMEPMYLAFSDAAGI